MNEKDSALTARRVSRRAFARGATASGAVAVAAYAKPSLTPLGVPRALAVSGPEPTPPPLTPPSTITQTPSTATPTSTRGTVTPTTTLTFYAAGVRGGAVQRAIYPAGGSNPTAHLFYAEIVKRF